MDTKKKLFDIRMYLGFIQALSFKLRNSNFYSPRLDVELSMYYHLHRNKHILSLKTELIVSYMYTKSECWWDYLPTNGPCWVNYPSLLSIKVNGQLLINFYHALQHGYFM